MSARQNFPAASYPFSDEICFFMDNHPEFLTSLKLSNDNRFLYIPLIFISSTPSTHPLFNDQVIGMWYIDKTNVRANHLPFFKQDFVVNKNSNHMEFITFTTAKIVSRLNSPYVKLINDFFSDYGNNGQYYHNGNRWDHHYNSMNDLPNEPRLRIMATNLLNRL
ncbi:MAG: hypothetical protein HZA34_02150 [Candidatus Pacebacteria bacterium]|nr:hypothetical protein [Candidatus Paceibacterota bacterium]